MFSKKGPWHKWSKLHCMRWHGSSTHVIMRRMKCLASHGCLGASLVVCLAGCLPPVPNLRLADPRAITHTLVAFATPNNQTGYRWLISRQVEGPGSLRTHELFAVNEDGGKVAVTSVGQEIFEVCQADDLRGAIHASSLGALIESLGYDWPILMTEHHAPLGDGSLQVRGQDVVFVRQGVATVKGALPRALRGQESFRWLISQSGQFAAIEVAYGGQVAAQTVLAFEVP